MDNKIVAAISVFIIITMLLVYIYANMNIAYSAVYVDPQTSDVAVGQDLTVRINISNVADLYGWEVRLGWNTTIMDAVNTTEGPFLKDGGNTFFTYTINATSGVIIADCALLGNLTGVSGDGTLVTLQFYLKEQGDCTLDIIEVTLLNSSEQPIDARLIDGHINVFSTSAFL